MIEKMVANNYDNKLCNTDTISTKNIGNPWSIKELPGNCLLINTIAWAIFQGAWDYA